MIKMSTVFMLASMVVVGVIGYPKMQEFQYLREQATAIKVQTKDLKDKLSSISGELSGLKQAYNESSLTTNFEIAKTINDLKGVDITSVTSLVVKDGELFVCSEVADINDVEFFNDQTEQMLFKLKLKNMEAFVKGLVNVPVSIRALEINQKKETVKLYVNTVFYREEESNG